VPALADTSGHLHHRRPRVRVSRTVSRSGDAGRRGQACGARHRRFRQEDLLLIKELVEKGTYPPIIDRTYDLDEIVEATRYVGTGQKTRNVVLRVAGDA
jgi:NADPH:quinone reductase-like Zn-dependent oxidoreductase